MSERTALRRADLIVPFRADMARLLATVSRIPEEWREQVICDGWTVKEILAHIAAWDREIARGLDELLAGRRPAFVSYREDEFNAQTAQASRGTSLADVLTEVQDAHEQLISRVERVADDQWQQPSPYQWSDQTPMTVASLFGYTYKGQTHYAGHTAEIEEWVRR
jgi:uncharacterized protein (TIGR03083 family)